MSSNIPTDCHGQTVGKKCDVEFKNDVADLPSATYSTWAVTFSPGRERIYRSGVAGRVVRAFLGDFPPLLVLPESHAMPPPTAILPLLSRSLWLISMLNVALRRLNPLQHMVGV